MEIQDVIVGTNVFSMIAEMFKDDVSGVLTSLTPRAIVTGRHCQLARHAEKRASVGLLPHGNFTAS